LYIDEVRLLSRREVELLKAQLKDMAAGKAPKTASSSAGDVTARSEVSVVARRTLEGEAAEREGEYQRAQEDAQRREEEALRMKEEEEKERLRLEEEVEVERESREGASEEEDGAAWDAMRSGSDDDQEDEEEDEDLPPELMEKLRVLSSVLIQRTWRSYKECAKAKQHAKTSERGAVASEAGSTGEGQGGGDGAIGVTKAKARTLHAHTTLGADSDDVCVTVLALQQALRARGLEGSLEAWVLADPKRKGALSRGMLVELMKSMSASNIDVDALLFEINPGSADGRVRLAEWYAAVEWSDRGDADPADLSQRVEKVYGSLDGIRARLAAKLSGGKASAANPLFRPPPVPGKGGGKMDDCVRGAREAMKARGFSNVAELFVFVDAEGRDYVTRQAVERAVRSLKVESLIRTQDVLAAIGLRRAEDRLAYR
jgi:hypothetical protein